MKLNTANEITHFYERGPSLSGRYTVWGYRPNAALRDYYVGSTDSAEHAARIVHNLNMALQLLNEANSIRLNTRVGVKQA